MRTIAVGLGMIAVVAACGGKNKSEDTTSGDTTISNTPGDTTDRSASMIPPEKMDQVLQLLNRIHVGHDECGNWCRMCRVELDPLRSSSWGSLCAADHRRTADQQKESRDS